MPQKIEYVELLNIGKALTEGVKAFEPGLLAKANRESYM